MIRLRHTECAYYFALIGLLLSGCASVGGSTSQIADTNPAAYQSAKINYRIDHQRVRTLAIQYPHPSGKTGYARVELVVESRDAGAKAEEDQGWFQRLGDLAGEALPGIHWSAGVEEAWAMDIPRAELDQLLVQLRETGYFHGAGRSSGGTEITAHIDGVTFCQPWRHVPALDSLAERVRREGSLASYSQPTAPESMGGRIAPDQQSFLASLQAYPTPAVRRLPPLQSTPDTIASGYVPVLRR